jgi:hypothetical protein
MVLNGQIDWETDARTSAENTLSVIGLGISGSGPKKQY